MSDNNDDRIRWDSLKSGILQPLPWQILVSPPLELAEYVPITIRYGLHRNVPCETDNETRAPTPVLTRRATDNFLSLPAPIGHTDDEHDMDDRKAHWLFDTWEQMPCIPERTAVSELWTGRWQIFVEASEGSRRPSELCRAADRFPISF